MAGSTIIVVMTAALVAAVGVLLYGVGRVVYGIAHYYVRERQPVREMRHPAYGVLKGEGELWTGTARSNDRKVRFTVVGTNFAPDDLLLQQVDGIMGAFAGVEKRAADHLRAQEPEISGSLLEVYGLEIADSSRPEDFTLEFVADADDSRIWRVEFEAGQPQRTGFDD